MHQAVLDVGPSVLEVMLERWPPLVLRFEKATSDSSRGSLEHRKIFNGMRYKSFGDFAPTGVKPPETRGALVISRCEVRISPF